MKRLRYLGLVTLLAVMTCNASGQTVRQKDRVISGNANLSKLNKEGAGAVKDDKLREVLLDSSVNAVILQDRTTQGGTTSGVYGYWILYAKGRDTNLTEWIKIRKRSLPDKNLSGTQVPRGSTKQPSCSRCNRRRCCRCWENC